MRTKSSGLTLSAVALIVLVFLAACGDSAPRLRTVTVNPSTATITQSAPVGGSRTHANSAVLDQQQFTATGLFSNGSTTDISGQVTWSSSNAAVATISSSGLATAVGPGTTTITATLLGVPGTATLTVTRVVSVAVTPSNPSIASGATEQFVATATITNADGSTGTMDVSSDPSTTWISKTTTVATISATGLATGLGQGTSLISATFGNATGSTTLMVGAPHAVSLMVTPATSSIAVGNTVAYTAVELWSDNTTHPLSGAVTFTSGTPATATINLTTGVAVGVAVSATADTITATEGALTGTAALTVSAAQARYAYLANRGDSTISQYSVSAAAGTFTALTPATVPAQIPEQVVVSPNGLFAYCICVTSPTTSAILYHIDPATGLLSVSSPTVAASFGTAGPNHAVIDPTGQFLFVNDANDPTGTGTIAGTVASYSIDQTSGALTLVNSVATGIGPTDVLVDHTGKYLYVPNFTDSTISEYSIGANGALTATGTVNGVDGPEYGAIDPANKYLYMTNGNPATGTVSIYSIGAGGTLTQVSTPVITGSTFLINAAVDPTNTYVYFVDSTSTSTGHLYGFGVYNSGTGALGAALPSSPYALSTSATGATAPTGIAIDPTGTLVAVDNNGTGDVSVLQDVPATGTLTLLATSPVPTGTNTGNTNPLFVVFYIAP